MNPYNLNNDELFCKHITNNAYNKIPSIPHTLYVLARCVNKGDKSSN